MPISFNTISDVRTNTHHAEVDNSRAVQGASLTAEKVLITGIKLAAGTIAELIPKPILSEDQAELYWGVGSQIAEMVRAFKANNRRVDLWGIGIDELAGGTVGTTTLTVTGTATANGVVHLHLDGHYIPVSIASGDAQNAIATKINTAIQAYRQYARLPWTSGVATNVVTLTAKWKGVEQAPVKLNHNDADSLPAGVSSIAIATGISGAGNPDVSEVITAMGSVRYTKIVMPWRDATNLGLLETELATRWGGMVQKMGHAYAAVTDTHANSTTLGDSRNSPHLTIMGANLSPSASWKWAAAVCAVDAGESDPARPRQTLPVRGVLPCKPADQWDDAERDLHLFDGISTHRVDAGGNITLERLITTYKVNSLSVPDVSYLDVTTIHTLTAIRDDLINSVSLAFPRHKLADDGGKLPQGQPIVTPLVMRAHILSRFNDVWAALGWVESASFEQFEEELIVERDTVNVNRLRAQLAPDLMNQFMGLSAQVVYLL